MLTGVSEARDLAYVESEKLESVRLYGNLDEYAYWFVDMLVGSPPQRTSVIIDTGSSVSAFSCNTCSHCGTHIDTAFNFTASLSASWAQCSPECSGSCSVDKCLYKISYSEGSSLTGTWFTDFVQLGDLSEGNLSVKAHLGCHQSETNLFYTQAANGIMGLAPPRPNSFPTVLSSLFTDGRVNTQIFALCLATEGGEFTVGGFNYDLNAGPLVWVPLVANMFYTVAIDSLSIDSAIIGGGKSFGRTIVDSGTTFVYFPKSIFGPLMAKLGVERCWSGSSKLSLPTLTFNFPNGIQIEWTPELYTFQHGDSQTCLSFEQNGSSSETVLGAAWMIGKNFVFDSASSRLGIANAECPMFVQREQAPPTVEHVTKSTPTAAGHQGTTQQNTSVVQQNVPSGQAPVVQNVPSGQSPVVQQNVPSQNTPVPSGGSGPIGAWVVAATFALLSILAYLYYRKRRVGHSIPNAEEVNVLMADLPRVPINDIESSLEMTVPQPIKFSIK